MTSGAGSIPVGILIIAVLIFVNGLVVLVNTAMNTVNINKVSEHIGDEESAKVKRLATILEKPVKLRYTGSILNYVFIIAGVYFTLNLPYNHIISLVIYFIVATTLGELFPRKLAIQHSEGVAFAFSGVEKGLMVLLTPITAILSLITDFFLKAFKQETRVEIKSYSEEQVMSMLEAGQIKGEIKEEGKKMINSIFAFDDELAYEIMTPRTDVFMIDINDSPDEYIDELMGLRFSRIPVCEDESDNVIGILHIKDYLIKARNDGFDNVKIRDILRKPYFVPESKNIDSLFFELQKEKQHIAILIDEYGGFSGIVTMEDIIEEVMGEIDDEYDTEEFAIRKADDRTYYVNGKVDLDDLKEETKIDLVSDNSETLGGFIIDLLGEIPGENDRNRHIDYGDYRFTILSVKERRIERVRVEIQEKKEADENEK